MILDPAVDADSRAKTSAESSRTRALLDHPGSHRLNAGALLWLCGLCGRAPRLRLRLRLCREHNCLRFRLQGPLIGVVASNNFCEQCAGGAVFAPFGQRNVIGRGKRLRERSPGVDRAGPAHIPRPIPIEGTARCRRAPQHRARNTFYQQPLAPPARTGAGRPLHKSAHREEDRRQHPNAGV